MLYVQCTHNYCLILAECSPIHVECMLHWSYSHTYFKVWIDQLLGSIYFYQWVSVSLIWRVYKQIYRYSITLSDWIRSHICKHYFWKKTFDFDRVLISVAIWPHYKYEWVSFLEISIFNEWDIVLYWYSFENDIRI